jgi:hypothetical protein
MQNRCYDATVVLPMMVESQMRGSKTLRLTPVRVTLGHLMMLSPPGDETYSFTPFQQLPPTSGDTVDLLRYFCDTSQVHNCGKVH